LFPSAIQATVWRSRRRKHCNWLGRGALDNDFGSKPTTTKRAKWR
jgi:hypothetical protein